MKKTILFIALLVVNLNLFAQNPSPFPRGTTAPFIELDTLTTAQRDAYVIRPNKRRIIFNIDNNRFEGYNGTIWEALASGGGSQTLQQTTDLGATTSNAIIIRNNSTPSLTVEATDFNKFISVSYDRLLYNSDGFNFNLRMPATLTGNYNLQVPNITQNDTIATQSYVDANSGINYTASNGIGLVGNDFQLGGAFSKNIGLTSTNNDFQLIARSTNQTGSKLFLQEAYSLFGSGISFLEFDDNSATGVATLQIKNKTPIVGQVLTVESILGNRARLGYATPSSANGDFVDLTTNQTITSRKTINATGQSNLLSISDEDFDGIVANNSGNSAAIKSTNTAAGRGIVSNGASSSTGEVFVGQNNNVDTFLVTKEGDITANSIDVGGDGSNVLLDDGTTTALPSSINTVATEITYAASMPLAFTEAQPNRYVTMVGNGVLQDVTGTLASGDLIILEIKGTGTITLTNGDASTKNITVSGTPVIATYYVLSDGNGKWFIDENSVGSGAVAVQTATGDGTTTIDWTVSPFMDFTFGAQNETFTLTPPTYPSKLRLKLTQDATGNRTITWVNNLYAPSGTLPALSTGANDVDVINLFWNGVNFEIDEDFNDYQLIAGTDVAAPTMGVLSSSNIGETTATLSWTAATDNIAVTNYKVYQDAVEIASLGNVLTYNVTGLTASTSYDFTVTALDAAGNESVVSNIVNITTSTALDADATALINAISTLTPSEETIVNDVITGLKTSGMWAKSHAIYLMIGGDANSVMYNAKDPQDLDGSFRLTPSGTITYTNVGADSDGTTGYFNTHYSPANDGTAQDVHMSFYSTEDSQVNGVDFGVYVNSNQALILTYKNSGAKFQAYGGGNGEIFTGDRNPSTGWLVGSRRSNIDMEFYLDNTSLGTQVNSNGTITALDVFLLAQNNNGTAGSFGTRTCAFASIGTGLTTQEISDSNTVIQAFITAKQGL